MNPSTTERKFLEDFIFKSSGIKMNKDRMDIFEKNIHGLLVKCKIQSYKDLVESVKNKDESLIIELIDLATINETLFMRDLKPFNILRKKLLPQIVKSNASDNSIIRIWCSACSTGQEAYSVAMSLLEEKSLIENRKIEIIATDICSTALEKAKKGIYNQFEVQRGLPATMLIKHFDKIGEFDWKIKDDLKEYIHFSRHNLMSDIHNLGTFHVIFCRNVLIYFEEDAKKNIVKRMASSLKDSGALFLGSAETTNYNTDNLDQDYSLRSLYYKK